MKTAGYIILVIASFCCGVFLSPEDGVTALLCAAGFAGITAHLIFATSAGQMIGIAIGLASILTFTSADIMFRSVPDAYPPYPPGLMDSLFQPEQFPRSEESFDEIHTRLHWYGMVCFLPICVGLLFLVAKFRQPRRRNWAHQDAAEQSATLGQSK